MPPPRCTLARQTQPAASRSPVSIDHWACPVPQRCAGCARHRVSPSYGRFSLRVLHRVALCPTRPSAATSWSGDKPGTRAIWPPVAFMVGRGENHDGQQTSHCVDARCPWCGSHLGTACSRQQIGRCSKAALHVAGLCPEPLRRTDTSCLLCVGARSPVPRLSASALRQGAAGRSFRRAEPPTGH